MSGFIKKLFGTLIQKPWEKEQMAIDSLDEGRAFDISSQKSAVIIIFGIATVLFSLVFTAYLYTIPPEQDTMYLLEPNLDLGRANNFFLSSCKKIFCYTDQIKKFPEKFKNKRVIIHPLVRDEFYKVKVR